MMKQVIAPINIVLASCLISNIGALRINNAARSGSELQHPTFGGHDWYETDSGRKMNESRAMLEAAHWNTIDNKIPSCGANQFVYDSSHLMIMRACEAALLGIVIAFIALNSCTGSHASAEHKRQEQIKGKADACTSGPQMACTSKFASCSQLKENVRQVIAVAIGVSPDYLADDEDLTDLGINSMQSAMIHSQLSSMTGMPLSKTLLAKMTNITDLTDFLWHELSERSETNEVLEQSASHCNQALAGLHALLMIWIFMQHSGSFGSTKLASTMSYGQVTMQFMFLMYGSLLIHSLPTELNSKDIFTFYLRKFRDLHIPYLLALACSVCIHLCFTEWDLSKMFISPCGTSLGFTIGSYVLGLSGWTYGFIFPLMVPLWYNSVLYLCILLSPWLLKFLRTLNFGEFLMTKYCCMILGIRFLLFINFHNDVIESWSFVFSPVQWLSVAFLGLLMSESWTEDHKAFVKGWRTDLFAMSSLFLIIASMFLGKIDNAISAEGDSSRPDLTNQSAIGIFFAMWLSDYGLWLALPIFSLLVHGLADGQGVLSQFLSLPALANLGGLTYPMYLFHMPICVGFTMLLRPEALLPSHTNGLAILFWYEAVGAYIVTVIVSVFVQRLTTSLYVHKA
eukprot:gnl/MRDRNA2_/MRDRNA2_86750_c0_seq3.p1 gnl/MRDRNA2_/MRDRNA2_86750_c0~~gnl/MRDRNA2_/MRDRNA2_86750_c0_seq3.p1  ORF type:complete len:625 (+),score=69.91 gnl/MRDRNA2_/MRDRNA2_86750_c0_seq3:130-2004(+)